MLGDWVADDRVSPTAHYTGYVWARSGMSHPAFVTNEGRLLHAAMRPLNTASRLAGGPTLEDFLLARHRLLDHLLTTAVDDGRITQVIEVAAGLSPRGWSFSARYGDRITYIETDLPGMVERKQRILSRAGSLSDHHRIVELDALADSGPQSLSDLAATLDPGRGTAIITEGLLNYFDRDAVLRMWRRFAGTLGGFAHGLYLSDLHVQGDSNPTLTRAFTLGLSAFVRGQVHLHFTGVDDATAGLLASGFDDAVLHTPADYSQIVGNRPTPGARAVRIVEASRSRNRRD
jgi:O-methyltransferase involved in polyketide biosynthesis